MPERAEAEPGAPAPATGPLGKRAHLPLLLLDVDGVLNPFAWHGPQEGTFTDFAPHVARGFRLLLSREMGRRLTRLPAEVCWATTWSDSIDEDVAPLAGLPLGLRIAARMPLEPAEAATNWKLVQVRRLVEREQRPFAWIDDDALDWPGPDGRTARSWADELALPHLLLAPPPERGLTPADLDALESWLQAVIARR